jgi:hypothetical protein
LAIRAKTPHAPPLPAARCGSPVTGGYRTTGNHPDHGRSCPRSHQRGL